MSAVYRVRQFVQAAGAWMRPEDAEEVRRYLSPAAAELYQAMPRYDQQHALHVLRTLQGKGHTDPDLLAAALLHDVGKTVHQTGALRPGLLEQIGKDQPRSWRQPFHVQQHHAAIGAELARAAGCSERTVELILHHEDRSSQERDPLLAVLRAADDVN
jgi:putative nucleotidyltransferase with HDIG domain